MDVSQLTPLLPGPLTPRSDSNASTDLATANADFETFLTLLTAQLRNQDPLSPLDSTEFIAQLASFSGVEQQIATNDRLDALKTQSLGGDIAAFATWIDKQATKKDGSFVANGQPVSFSLGAVAEATAISARVTDASGLTIASFPVQPDENGNAVWDGLSDRGAIVDNRLLTINLKYFNSGEEIATSIAEVPRRVVGLRGTPEGIVLDLEDGGTVTPENVVRLSDTRTLATD